MKYKQLLNSIPDNGVMAIIQRDMDSGGEYFALQLLRILLEENKTVFVFLYEPFTVFRRNCENVGLSITDYLGRNLVIFDVFGSVYHIPSQEEGIHQLTGYMEDSVFIVKLKEWAIKTLESYRGRDIWIFSYTSTGICKLFTKPSVTYKLIWGLRKLLHSTVKCSKTILTLTPLECSEIEDIVYACSDIVIETFVDEGYKRVGLTTKGPDEGESFSLFGRDEE
ncbi:hypothetical protein FH039_02140 [Thermococcus indicus]|uniref:KaiC-like domain-containing protein n=1 Tax=Thermococcus indicus TaxID=2586643 RepID=A0A4Y5SIN6_9EURY|nr:hypothetical protein [Thermococcus indicus]QDA30653.1 hypothetical protein FH039_02140 [Thermococcus indicus]